MKVIALFDVPETLKLDIVNENRANLNIMYEAKNMKLLGVKPLPQKKPKDNSNELNLGYELGWNACIDEILGETE